MKTCWKILFAVLAALLGLVPAQAAITCTTISSPGVSINYVNNTTPSVQTYFTVSCTRSSASDPSSVSYDVAADNGLSPLGTNNRARLNGAYLRYDVHTDAGCGKSWKRNTRISDSITWTGGATGTITKQTSFWGCITTAQTATASGAYTDTVTMTMRYGNNQTITGSIPVNIYAPALCTFTTPPGNISIPYVAFGAQVTGSTSFAVRCTDGMPYTLTTDVPEAVLTGVRYTLGLSATASNGTGAPQTHTITATVPGGQAGQCAAGACTGSQTHTLTIAY